MTETTTHEALRTKAENDWKAFQQIKKETDLLVRIMRMERKIRQLEKQLEVGQ